MSNRIISERTKQLIATKEILLAQGDCNGRWSGAVLCLEGALAKAINISLLSAHPSEEGYSDFCQNIDKLQKTELYQFLIKQVNLPEVNKLWELNDRYGYNRVMALLDAAISKSIKEDALVTSGAN